MTEPNQNSHNPYENNPYIHSANAGQGGYNYGNYSAGHGAGNLGGSNAQAWSDPRYTNASLGQRIGAIVLDAIICSIINGILFAILRFSAGPWDTNDLTSPQSVIISIVSAVLWIVYKIGFEGTKGQTPGKAVFRIRIVPIDGQPLSLTHAIKRNVNAFYTFLPFIGGFAVFASYVARFFSVVNSPFNQGYHDGWAKVRLVREFK